jgi:hypothetical protein
MSSRSGIVEVSWFNISMRQSPDNARHTTVPTSAQMEINSKMGDSAQ